MKEELIQVISELYVQRNELQTFNNHDKQVLIDAFNGSERLWRENFQNIAPIKYILFSEAPFFVGESYIYNTNTDFTQFFRENDLYQALNEPLRTDRERRAIPLQTRKAIFINHLNRLGFVIVDISPFALSPYTAVQYNNLSVQQYNQLLNETIPHYLQPKLTSIQNNLAQDGEPLNLIFRYKRLNDFPSLNDFLLNFFGPVTRHSIWHQGGGINREALGNIFNAS